MQKEPKKNKTMHKWPKTLMYTVAFAILVEVPFLQRIQFISNTTSFLQLFLFFILIVNVLRMGKVSSYNLLAILYIIIYVFCTVANSANLTGVISESIHILSISFLIENGIKKDGREIAKGAFLYYACICLINFISMLLFPNGLYKTTNLQYSTTLNWILGYKNFHILYISQLIMWGTINSFLSSKKITKITIVITIFSIIMTTMAGSTTSTIGLLLLLVLESIIITSKKTKIINIANFIVAYLTSFIAIIFFRLQEKYDDLIFALTSKHSDFVGRTYIWDSVIKFISQKPLLGYGKEQSVIRQNKTSQWKAAHAHNLPLEITYRTGIVGTSIFILMLGLAFSKLQENRDNQISKFLIAMIISIGIMTITEYYDLQFLIPLLTVSYNINYLIYK